MPAGGKASLRSQLRIDQRQASLPKLESGLQSFGKASGRAGNFQAILNDGNNRGQGFARVFLRFIRAESVAEQPDPQVALGCQEFKEFRYNRADGTGHGNGYQDSPACELLLRSSGDACGTVRFHFPATTGAQAGGESREEQFQIIIDLGHRANRGPCGAHAVLLLDANGRRDA